MNDTTSQAFFEDKYQREGDPWNFAGSPYEQHRYDVIIAALEHRRYGRTFEPGCSVGVLTARLAAICGCVEAIDISPAAVQHARMRCKHLPDVEITCGALPHFLPRGIYDLIVFSEIGYYLPEDELFNLGNILVQRLAPGGVLIAAHWLGASQDHLLSGGRVHQILHRLDGLVHEYSQDHAELHGGFRLDRWVRS